MEKLTIVKVGGNVIDSAIELQSLLDAFAALDSKKILVHGGGKLATELSKRLGYEVQMHEGRRITGDNDLQVATMVYAGWIGKYITAQLQVRGCNAMSLCGADGNLIRATRRPVKDIDYGWVGDLTADSINTQLMQLLVEGGTTPVLNAITHNGQGQLLNTNADTIASVVAIAMSRLYDVDLIYVFEKQGLLADVNDNNSVIQHINATRFEDLKRDGIVSGGMLPKADNALQAVAQGVKRVVMGNISALNPNNKLKTVFE